MKQEITQDHFNDHDGNPAGGLTESMGLTINWQDGPLVDKNTGRRKEPNGAFVETVIAAAIGRLEYYQQSKFACDFNARAIEKLNEALEILGERTRDRERRLVEGTHQV